MNNRSSAAGAGQSRLIRRIGNGIAVAQMSEMTLRPKFEIALLATAVAVTRFVFRSHYLYDLDSVNFGLAIGRFDPRVYQPHPPGYFLYVCLGRVLNFLFHDANLALVVISILASCGVGPPNRTAPGHVPQRFCS